MVPAADEPDLSAPELDQRATDVRNAAVMSVGTLLSRATGVVRVSVTLAALGTTNVVANSYAIANTTPNIVYELILGGILTSVFVPLLVDWAKRYGEDEGRIAGARFLTFVLVVLSAVTLVAMVFAPWIMRLYLIGVKDPADHAAQLELGTFFLRWFLPQIVFYGVGAVAAGILTANRRFAAQMFAPVLNNIAVIATMLVFIAMHGKGPMTLADVSTTERLVLAAGTTLGVVAMTIALWPSLRAIGFRWRLRFDWRHETIRRLLHLARWVALYVVVNQIAYFFIIVFNGRVPRGRVRASTRRRSSSSRCRTRSSRCRSSPRCCRASPDAGPTATSAACASSSRRGSETPRWRCCPPPPATRCSRDRSSPCSRATGR